MERIGTVTSKAQSPPASHREPCGFKQGLGTHSSLGNLYGPLVVRKIFAMLVLGRIFSWKAFSPWTGSNQT